MSKTLWLEQSEIRLHDDGTVDEIVIRDPSGNCLFHLEQMSAFFYWMAIYPVSRKLEEAHINIGSSRGHVQGVINYEGSAAPDPAKDEAQRRASEKFFKRTKEAT